MLDLSDIKITRRDEPVLHVLVEGCSNKEIAEQLNINPRTVKLHLRTLFLRAGIKDEGHLRHCRRVLNTILNTTSRPALSCRNPRATRKGAQNERSRSPVEQCDSKQTASEIGNGDTEDFLV
jgi:DNA-binding CsgD family transcriptional regulator